MRYPFLSPDWIAAMREVRTEFSAHDREVEFDLAANVTVTDPPFGDGPVFGHIDTSGPTLLLEEGHLDNPDFGIEIPYDVAKQLFVGRDPAQLMPALLGGRVKLTGDSSKLLALASLLSPPANPNTPSNGTNNLGTDNKVSDGPPPEVLADLAQRIEAITEP